MKCAIIYASVHHQNTYKLLEAIQKKYPDVEHHRCCRWSLEGS